MSGISELSARLQTVQVVPLTPFDERLELAEATLEQLAGRLTAAGVSCFIPCAGSAEFDSLLDGEIVRALACYRAAAPAAVVLAPVGRQLRAACELARRAADAGADAVLAMPLAFPYLADAGARDYYRELLEQSPLPVLVYKKGPIPSDDLLLELAEHPRLIGVKYAVNDLDAFGRVVARAGGRSAWYCGSAERFAPYFWLAGARGYTSGAANVCPRLTLAMHAALAAGRWEEALRLQRLIAPIEHYRARSDSSYNIAMLKQAIRTAGLDCGECRPPQRRLTAVERREIDELLEPILQAEAALAAGDR